MLSSAWHTLWKCFICPSRQGSKQQHFHIPCNLWLCRCARIFFVIHSFISQQYTHTLCCLFTSQQEILPNSADITHHVHTLATPRHWPSAMTICNQLPSCKNPVAIANLTGKYKGALCVFFSVFKGQTLEYFCTMNRIGCGNHEFALFAQAFKQNSGGHDALCSYCCYFCSLKPSGL